jgi:hypothetical protein
LIEVPAVALETVLALLDQGDVAAARAALAELLE